MRVMVYTFNGTTAWWRYIASRLRFATETVLVSDLPDADIDISPAFHRHVRRAGAAGEALETLGEPVCSEIIGRCRLLRVLDRDLALRMVGAMWRTIEELLDREKPDLFLCFVVDRYILDLFERALARRGVRYAGLAIGVLPDTFMFMARGEYIPIREPSEGEVDAAVSTLSQPQFVPNYVSRSRFGLARFLSLYALFTARWIAFEALRLARRLPFDYRYLSARWPACGYRVRLRDWGVMRYFRRDWEQILEGTPFGRRVFVGLSVNPEAAIEYWVKSLDLVDYADVLDRVARALGGAGFRLFVKDHPSQFGFRQIELFRALAKYEAVTFVPYDVPGQTLIDRCQATFTWTGTVGFQAAIAGRRPVVEGGAYYLVDGLFIVMHALEDLDKLPDRIDAFIPGLEPAGARRALVRHVLRSSAPGAYLSWSRFAPGNPECVRRAETMVASLNRYLPALAKGEAA